MRAVLARCDAHLARKRLQRDPDALGLVEPRIPSFAIERPDLECGLGELVCEQPETGNERRPAPVGCLDGEDVDAESIAGLGVRDVHRPVYLVELCKYESREGGGCRGGENLAIGGVQTGEGDDTAGGDV